MFMQAKTLALYPQPVRDPRPVFFTSYVHWEGLATKNYSAI